MEPLLVLFDIDGTLVSAAGAGRRSLEAAFRSVHGVDGIAAITASVRFEGRTDPIIIAEMARVASVPSEEVERRADEFREAYLAALREEMSRPDPRRRVMPGVLPLLDHLRGSPGVHLGLVTGNIERGARLKLEPFGLNAYFRHGGFSSDHPDRREIARIATERLSRAAGIAVPSARVTVVGDTEDDVSCARANGYRVVAVESGWVSRERLEAAAPDALFSDLTDLRAVTRAIGADPETAGS